MILNRILDTIFRRPIPDPRAKDDDAVLNFSLELAQEWGHNWLKPVQPRLSKVYPRMSNAELDHFNSVAQGAMKFAHDLVYTLAEELGRDSINEENWRETVLARYPWIDKRNLKHLFSTGQYYAWKDFG